ncbi:MAG: hypothetical protein AB1716_24655 [Planctomycetota bacterium]
MADEQTKTESAATQRRLPVTLIAVVGVAVVEAGAFLAIFKFAGAGPQPAHGEESHALELPATTQTTAVAEVPVLRTFRVPNDKTGLIYIYDMDLSVVVSAAERETMETLVKERSGEIGDRVARIMRAASDRVLREDDLRALRVQVQEALAEIAGREDLVQRVLIPRFVPIRSD